MTSYPSQRLPSPTNGRADTTARPAHPPRGVSPASHGGSRPVRPTPPPKTQPQRYPLVSELAPLGALKTAPGCARGHVKNTLTTWGMAAYIEVTELLISEMVTNAVEASTKKDGHPIYIGG